MTTKFYGLPNEVLVLIRESYWVDTQDGNSEGIWTEIEDILMKDTVKFWAEEVWSTVIGLKVIKREKTYQMVWEIKKELVEKYYQDLCKVYQTKGSVTVFVNEDDLHAGRPCADFRSGTEILPRGSWVVGFLYPAKYAVFKMPYLKNRDQSHQMLEVLKEALLAAGEIDTTRLRRLVRKGTLPLTGKIP